MVAINDISIKERAVLTDAEKIRVAALWSAEYPAEMAFSTVREFDAFLGTIQNHRHFIATTSDDEIAGWLVSFDRDGERWFSIIVDADFHGRRIGFGLLDAAFSRDRELNGWVVPIDGFPKRDGAAYRSPLGFYLKYGFHVVAGEKFAKYEIETVKIRMTKA